MWILSFSRVSELQIRKRSCPWRQMPFPIYWGWRTDQQEVEERWCERISCDIEGVYAVGLCVLRLLLVKVYSTWTWKIGIKSHRRMLQRHMAPNQNSGKKGSIAKIQKSVPLERSFCAPKLKERSHEETLHQERCARNSVWDMAKILKSSRIRTISRLTFSVTSKGCQHLPLRRDQMSEHSLSIQHGCSYEWVSGQQPRLTQKWETYFLQDRQFRASCGSRLICQFWKQFVFCNATTGIVGTRCTLRLWEQGCIKFIFGFGFRVKWRTCSKETSAGISGRWQERCERSVGGSTISG